MPSARGEGVLLSSLAAMSSDFVSVSQVRDGLKKVNYLADEGIAGVVYLAQRLGKPVLIEGPAGTGKTQLAKSVAELTGARLIRLQCYEGLDESKALYEWNYKKQLLRIQVDKKATAGQMCTMTFSVMNFCSRARCSKRSLHPTQ